MSGGTEKPLSKRAEKMLERMRRGAFYTVEEYRCSPVMAELVRAGLVDRMGRVETIVACFVPAGSTPGTCERIAGLHDTPSLPEAARAYLAALDAMDGSATNAIAYTNQRDTLAECLADLRVAVAQVIP